LHAGAQRDAGCGAGGRILIGSAANHMAVAAGNARQWNVHCCLDVKSRCSL